MKLKFKSLINVPEGPYKAKFMGIILLEPKPGEVPRPGYDGKPMPPGMSWQFEILDGPEKGKQVYRVTGRQPGPKNLCGKFLAAITDRVLTDDDEIDVSEFVGKAYRIRVVKKETGEGTVVSDAGLVPLDAASSDGTANPPF